MNIYETQLPRFDVGTCREAGIVTKKICPVKQQIYKI